MSAHTKYICMYNGRLFHVAVVIPPHIHKYRHMCSPGWSGGGARWH